MAAVHRPDIASVGAPPGPHRIANDKCPYDGAGNTEHPTPPIILQHQQAANDHYCASDDAEHPIPSTHGSTHILMALLAKLTASIRLHAYVLWTEIPCVRCGSSLCENALGYVGGWCQRRCRLDYATWRGRSILPAQTSTSIGAETGIKTIAAVQRQ
jgi:hypothetical protein